MNYCTITRNMTLPAAFEAPPFAETAAPHSPHSRHPILPDLRVSRSFRECTFSRWPFWLPFAFVSRRPFWTFCPSFRETLAERILPLYQPAPLALPLVIAADTRAHPNPSLIGGLSLTLAYRAKHPKWTLKADGCRLGPDVGRDAEVPQVDAKTPRVLLEAGSRVILWHRILALAAFVPAFVVAVVLADVEVLLVVLAFHAAFPLDRQ